MKTCLLVPKHFFTPEILIKRKALSPIARRAGYVGSVIMYEDIPVQGKIAVIAAHTELSRDIVMKNYARSIRLRVESMNLRGWIMDILKCIDIIAGEVFTLSEINIFAGELSAKHPDNHNITA